MMRDRWAKGGRLVILCLAVMGAGGGCSAWRASRDTRVAADALRPQLAASASGINADRTAAAPLPSPPDKPAAGPAPVDLQRALAINPQAPYRLRQGDPVIIYLRGILPRDDEVQDIVDEKGFVTLPFIDDVPAVGKTASELERDIQRTYIDRGIYRTVTVNVILPSQSFFVQGEVRAPQRYPLLTGVTIMQAIAAAGGYTEFADPKRVTLTRGGVVRTINMREIERDPKRDFMIESGDVIRVPRSIF